MGLCDDLKMKYEYMLHWEAIKRCCLLYCQLDSNIQSTHDSSWIVISYANIVSSKASEFCSLSKIDSTRLPLKVAEISLQGRTALLKLVNFVSYEYDL